MDQQQQVSQAARHWNELVRDHAQFTSQLWTSNPLVRARINQLISGDPAVDCWQFALRFLSQHGVSFPVAKVVSLGCGTGELERGLSKYSVARKFVGLDISAESIQTARAACSELSAAKFVYEIADLNKVSFGLEEVDIVVAHMSIHHITNLEGISEAIKNSLVPNGWCVFNEFVGAKRFQWSNKQLDLINRALDALPRFVKTDVNGQIKNKLIREKKVIL